MSCWAQEGVAAAYQSRAVSDEFDLGADCLFFGESGVRRHTFTLDLYSRQVAASSHQAIPCLVSSVSWRNDYHPVKR